VYEISLILSKKSQNLKMWQNVGKVKNVGKMWRNDRKCGKSHIYVVIGYP
jgi:hypothetical protein